MDYQEAKREFRTDGYGWGNTMTWLFAISEVLHFDRDDDTPETEWGYRPSPIATGPEDSLEVEIAREMPDAELVHFGRVLNRYADMLRAQGHDY